MINHRAIALLIEEKRYPWEEDPDFTLPEWHRKLELWLCQEENHEFCERFWWYVFNKAHTLMWKTTRLLWQDLPSLLIDFLSTKECQKQFGWEICPECIKAIACTGKCKCKNCNSTGKIKRPWFRAMEATDEST